MNIPWFTCRPALFRSNKILEPFKTCPEITTFRHFSKTSILHMVVIRSLSYLEHNVFIYWNNFVHKVYKKKKQDNNANQYYPKVMSWLALCYLNHRLLKVIIVVSSQGSQTMDRIWKDASAKLYKNWQSPIEIINKCKSRKINLATVSKIVSECAIYPST